MTILLEQRNRAERKYIIKVNKAVYHNNLIDAAMEYIRILNIIVEEYEKTAVG